MNNWNVIFSGIRDDGICIGNDGDGTYSQSGGWWASDNNTEKDGIIFYLNMINEDNTSYMFNNDNTYSEHKSKGYSVRCIKD